MKRVAAILLERLQMTRVRFSTCTGRQCSLTRLVRDQTALRRGNDRERGMTPVPYRVVDRRRETDDVTTLCLAPVAGVAMAFRPGPVQHADGLRRGRSRHLGEQRAPVERSARAHGARRRASDSRLVPARIGDLVGVRGPFGTDWGMDEVDIRPTTRTSMEDRTPGSEATWWWWPEGSASPRCAEPLTSWWPGAAEAADGCS